MSVPFDVVLFDLGGVLFQVGGVAVMRELTGIDSDEELWRMWLECRWVRAYERGDCTTDEFAAGIVADWRLPISPDAFVTSFTDWELVPFPGAAELVNAVKATTAVGCLSNTNELHWRDHFSRYDFLSTLDHRFVSYELGVVKPDRAIFDAVLARLDVAPERVLFVDDNAVNVAGAAASGISSHLVRGTDDAKRQLIDLGVL